MKMLLLSTEILQTFTLELSLRKEGAYTDSLQVRLMGWWLPLLPVVAEYNHKLGIFARDVARDPSSVAFFPNCHF